MAPIINADKPRAGWYKLRYDRNGPWQPVAIWQQDGELVCRVGNKTDDPHRVWTWCADKPVAKEAAKFAFANGYWPDEPAPVPLSNLPADPFEALKIEIEAQRTRAEEWLGKRPTVMQQADADLATNMQRELLKLLTRADGMFTAEKEPLLSASRACDDKYRFRAVAKDVAEKLRKVFGKFLAEKEARLQAEAAAEFQAQRAKAEAERKRLEAEREAKLRDDPVAALTESPPELPLGPLAPEPVKVAAGGGIGKRAGLQDVWIGTVNDYATAAAYFADHPKLRETVDKLVAHQCKDLKSATKIPGVTVTKERRAA